VKGEREVEEKRETGTGQLTIFQKLCVKIMEDPGFATDLLEGTGQERKAALTGFLDGEEFAGDQVQALDDLIEAVSTADIEKISDLVQTLDGIVPAIAI
jgi:hypothetical protein